MEQKSVTLARIIIENHNAQSSLKDYYFANEKMARAVRQNVYRLLTEEGKSGTITLTQKGARLYVGQKQEDTYVTKLEKMVRKLMNSTDSDILYEQATELLGGNNGI